uniref:NADH-ubiquinone oxidoreductase chain 6 n=1 Tax=Prionoglaris stygia TaxID=1954335 RepID=A0A343QCD2_9NEOP|nr:NADH dehydrogenase subunit 6 [Prionoglaris stygia]ATU07079.1 NADH dehydrogenase subunit 6 [Prionoglaris stygia]
MMKICLLLTMFISFTFMYLMNPISMGLMLIMQTLMISLITFQLINNFWFSYILMLVMIGGMLIMFIYVISVAENPIFNTENKHLMMIPFISTLTILNPMLMESFYKNMMSNSIFTMNLNINLIKLVNSNSNISMIMMVLLLLFTLIVVVKITDFHAGPLRKLN